MSTKQIAAGVMLAFSSVLLGVGPCCLERAAWQTETPCTGTSTTFCDTATTSEPSGTAYMPSINNKTATCTTWNVPAGGSGLFFQGPCDQPPTGYTRIGPPLTGNTCCYAPATAWSSTAPANPSFTTSKCKQEACSL